MASPAEEAAELRAATREAHEAMKDLDKMLKRADQYVKDLQVVANGAVKEAIKPVIVSEIAKMTVTIKEATDRASEQVFARFDTIKEALLGEDRAARRRGEPSVPEMIEKRAERNG